MLLPQFGAGFAFLDLAEEELHVLVLAHPLQNVVAQIQQSRMRSQATAVELAELLIRSDGPAANLHLAFIFDFLKLIMLVLAAELPKLLVAVIVLESAACELECELRYLEIEAEVDMLELLVEDP